MEHPTPPVRLADDISPMGALVSPMGALLRHLAATGVKAFRLTLKQRDTSIQQIAPPGQPQQVMIVPVDSLIKVEVVAFKETPVWDVWEFVMSLPNEPRLAYFYAEGKDVANVLVRSELSNKSLLTA